MMEDVPCTVPVVTVNVILVAPNGTVALDGACAAVVLLLVNEITAPLGGAAPLSSSVPVEEFPPTTVLGFNVSDVKPAAVTERLVVRVIPP